MSSQELSTTPFYPEEYLVWEAESKPGRGAAFIKLQEYLLSVLRWQFRAEDWEITGNLELRSPLINNSQNIVVPDVTCSKVSI